MLTPRDIDEKRRLKEKKIFFLGVRPKNSGGWRTEKKDEDKTWGGAGGETGGKNGDKINALPNIWWVKTQKQRDE